jgi:uncharacterized membrane protein YgcG
MSITDKGFVRHSARVVGLAGALLIALVATAFALSTPTRDGWVTDAAGILDTDTASGLARDLVELQRQTGAEVVVVTLKSLEGVSIETWGDVLGETWGIGRSGGQDNGALLIVAPNDRKVRIAVGYGLGNRLSDAAAQAIIDDDIVPNFRRGDFAGGIRAGIDSIAARIEGRSVPALERSASSSAVSTTPTRSGSYHFPLWIVIVGGLVVVIVVVLIFNAMSVLRSEEPYRAEMPKRAPNPAPNPQANPNSNPSWGPYDNTGYNNGGLLGLLLSNSSRQSSWGSSSGGSLWSSSSSSSRSSGSSWSSSSSSSSSGSSHRSFGGGASGSW